MRGVTERLVVAQGGNVQQWRESIRKMNAPATRAGKGSRQGGEHRNGSDTDTTPENNGNEGFPPPAKKSHL